MQIAPQFGIARKAQKVKVAAKVFNAPAAPIATPTMYYVVSIRGAYAMQRGTPVKNIKVYAVFGNAMVAANYVANNKMGLFAQVVMQ